MVFSLPPARFSLDYFPLRLDHTAAHARPVIELAEEHPDSNENKEPAGFSEGGHKRRRW
jgi:hypothetical protein